MFTNLDFMNKYLTIIKDLGIEYSIEIGAYDADFSIAMSDYINPKNIWAIEANPNIHLKFLNQLKNINYLNLAISDISGHVYINTIIDIPESKDKYWFDAASSILPRKENNIVDSIKIKSKTLDEFILENKINKNIALWIDCEGANKEVLVSAENSFKFISCIYIEVENEEVWENQWLIKDVVFFLEKKGFVLVKQSSYNTLQSDLIFIKKELWQK